MEKDINHRHSINQKIKENIKTLSPKIKEKERILTFNRLIEDSNRRMEIKENKELMKDLVDTNKRSNGSSRKMNYKDKEWLDIYNQRFKQYEERKISKVESQRKTKEEDQLKKRKISF